MPVSPCNPSQCSLLLTGAKTHRPSSQAVSVLEVQSLLKGQSLYGAERGRAGVFCQGEHGSLLSDGNKGG